MKKTKKEHKSTKSTRKPQPSSAIKGLQLRNMRLTREIDRLGTIVAVQGEILGRIYQILQQKKFMPFDPLPSLSQGKPMKVKSPKGNSGGPIVFGSTPGAILNYTVLVKKGETILGWLSSDGVVTLDPKKIGQFTLREEIQQLLAKAPLPEGAKPEIEEHRDTGSRFHL